MKFKEGDKVRIRRDSEYAGQSSEVGTVIKVFDYNEYRYKVRFPNTENPYYEEDLESAYEVKYRKTEGECLCPRCIEELNPCKEEYANLLMEVGKADMKWDDPTFPLSFYLERAEKYPTWIPWLLENGIIKKEEEKEEEKFHVKVGDTFTYYGSSYSLRLLGGNIVAMVSNGEMFASYLHGYSGETALNKVKDFNNITLDEFKSILRGSARAWKEIYATKR